MASETKEKIMEKALEMFAECGYKGTNLRDLAKALNLSKSALYRHFESKDDIWNAIIERMEDRYEKGFGSVKRMPEIPKDLKEFESLVMKMVDFTLHDRDVALSRKVVTSEQFHFDNASDLAYSHLFSGVRDMFTLIFERMIKKGLFIKEKPEILSLCFVTPISALIHVCDLKPEKEKETIKQTKEFINHFIKTYGK